MRVGLIGLGSIGMRHARNIQELYPEFEVAVLTKRASWEEAGPRTKLLSSAEEFFATPCDAYFVTNETNLHVETARECLRHSPKGVFIEKPISHTRDGVDELREVLRASGAVCMVGYCMRYFKPLMQIQKLLQDGAIGKMQSMRVSVGQDLRGWRQTDYRQGYAADPERGGGVVLDLIHELNYPAWLIGEPLRFVAGGVAKLSDLEIKTEDTAEALLTSPSGVVVSVHQDYLQVPGRRSCEVYGEKGTLLWQWALNEPDAKHIIEVRTKDGIQKVEVEEVRGEMFKRELRDFFSHVERSDAWSNLDEAIADLDTVIMLKKNKL